MLIGCTVEWSSVSSTAVCLSVQTLIKLYSLVAVLMDSCVSVQRLSLLTYRRASTVEKNCAGYTVE